MGPLDPSFLSRIKIMIWLVLLYAVVSTFITIKLYLLHFGRDEDVVVVVAGVFPNGCSDFDERSDFIRKVTRRQVTTLLSKGYKVILDLTPFNRWGPTLVDALLLDIHKDSGLNRNEIKEKLTIKHSNLQSIVTMCNNVIDS